jgi:hypothetical protein
MTDYACNLIQIKLLSPQDGMITTDEFKVKKHEFD